GGAYEGRAWRDEARHAGYPRPRSRTLTSPALLRGAPSNAGEVKVGKGGCGAGNNGGSSSARRRRMSSGGEPDVSHRCPGAPPVAHPSALALTGGSRRSRAPP